MRKLRVGVVFGGRSGEHEVSLASAASVLGALDRDRYEVVPMGIAKDAIGQGITAVDAGRHDRLERLVVAALGSLDELGLHRRLR